MVQFNLLPAVKLEYVRAQRMKRLLILASIAVSIAALLVLLLSIVTVDIVQKKSLSDLNNDINHYSKQLKSTPDLNKILTVQNQLSTLTSLHDQKPVASRLFGYLAQTTPAQASLNKLTVDFQANTISIGGEAPSLDTVSTYTDTLKATKYTVAGSSKQASAFSSVVLSSFGRDNQGASFTITANFDPIIFNSKDAVSLVVPTTVTTNQSNIFGTGN